MATKSETSMSNNPYSFQNTTRVLSDNFGLFLIAGATFLLGFVTGSLWTENSLLKNGGGGLAAAPSAAAPAAPADPNAAPAAAPLSDADWAEIQKDPAAVIGDPKAKLTIVEFTDYQCPFCSRHFNDTHKTLMEQYVKPGKVKIVIRDQALPFHPNALPAAMAARCAGEQGKYAEMHDQLFGNQDVWANLGKDAAVDKFAEFANTIGINGANLKTCVNGNKFQAAITADGTLGTRVGAGGTPTFFIEKQPVVGAQPLTEFTRLIDAAL
jgi:protein-disulfide isomerase